MKPLEDLLDLECTPNSHPIPFDWDKDKLHDIFNMAAYAECDLNGRENNDDDELEAPNGVGIQPVTMFEGDFYILRPNCAPRPGQVDLPPFELAKLKRLETQHGVAGARMQYWESSTRGDSRQDWIEDPYHCNGRNMDGMRYTNLFFCICISLSCNNFAWVLISYLFGYRLDEYDWVPASDLQDRVTMKKLTGVTTFPKKLWVQEGVSAHGIKRLVIVKRDQTKVRNHAQRMRGELIDGWE